MKIRTLLVVVSIFFLVTLASPTEAHAVIQNLNGQTGMQQTFQNDSNIRIDSSNNIHNIIWQNLLPISRGGTGASSFTNGSIPFIFNGIFSQDNSNFFWDNISKRLGIGTSSPTTTLDVSGSAKVTSLISSGDATINNLTVGLGGGSVSGNTALGKDALLNAASSNYGLTAIGQNALKNPLANKGDSTAVGSFALWSGGGDQNTAIGSSSMRNTTTGQYNTAVGFSALGANTSGDANIGIGFEPLYQNTTGSHNIAIGWRTAFFQADGSTNLTSPENSIYIGDQARGYDNNDDNSIVIGANAIGAGANTAVVGNSSLGHIYFGSAVGNASIHARKLFLGSSTVAGCVIMGDSDGSGVSYLTVNDGVLSVSTTAPSACQ